MHDGFSPRRGHDYFRKEDQEIFFTDPEREKQPFDEFLRELETYRTRGAKLSLNGVEFEPRTIANLVAESGSYMREYEFTRDGQVESVDFRSVRNR